MSSESANSLSDHTKEGEPFGLDQEEVSLEDSRSTLRREMEKMRKSLTIGEQTFLESLVVNGNEVEVQVAIKRLGDISIFLPHEHEEEKIELDELCDDDDDAGFGDLISIDRGAFADVKDASIIPEKSLPPTHSVGRRQSSVKVMQALESRRSCEVRGKIWKAHEYGIAAENGARKVDLRRTSCTNPVDGDRERLIRGSSFLSGSTQDLLLDGGTNEELSKGIFRETSGSTVEVQQPKLQMATDALSPTAPKSIMRPPDVPSPSHPAAVRSPGFRKSVSFQASEPRQRSQSFTKGSSAQPPPKNPLRREVSDLSMGSESGTSHIFSSTSTIEVSSPLQASVSAASFPSLHQANTIRSESAASIPSLHRAVPVRSESIASTAASISSDPADGGETHSKPVLLRMASRNHDFGEGIEVTELDDDEDLVNKARLYASMLSLGEGSSATSWDESEVRDNVFREFRTTLSEDETLSRRFLGSARSLLNDSVRTVFSEKQGHDIENDSWDLESHTDEHHDAWDVLKDPYAIGYGANGTLPFRIFGTHADDESSKPHVLSPPLMESLQNFLPYGLSEQNFWMKYSLVRDGASMHTLLQHIRGAVHTIIAIETSDGEVFGSFTSELWRKNWVYFGNGESFLWRMRYPRTTECHSLEEQAHLESEIDVYPWSGENNCVQLCTHDTLAVGGGSPSSEKKDEIDALDNVTYGFGIALDRLLLHGTSSHCATFGSPPLSNLHPDGSPFEILNMEVWTLTPSYSVEDAEKLELGKLFLSSQ